MSLLAPEDVRLLTGRRPSGVTEQTIDAAVALFEAATRRPLESRTVTERLHMKVTPGSSRRVVIPSRRPVTEVTAPEGAEVLTAAMVRLPSRYVSGEVEVVYTGGYTADTLPADIARVIAQLAAGLADQVDRGGREVSAAADAVSIGGDSVRLRDPGYGELERLAPGCTSVIQRWSL